MWAERTYHVVEVNEGVIDGNNVNSSFESDSRHQTTNTTKTTINHTTTVMVNFIMSLRDRQFKS